MNLLTPFLTIPCLVDSLSPCLAISLALSSAWLVTLSIDWPEENGLVVLRSSTTFWSLVFPVDNIFLPSLDTLSRKSCPDSIPCSFSIALALLSNWAAPSIPLALAVFNPSTVIERALSLLAFNTSLENSSPAIALRAKIA